MTAIVKTLTEMASWIGKNIELVKTIAQIVGLGMGFKLLKTIVTSSLGTALEMFSSLNKSLGLATKGVTSFLSVTGKIVQDIRNFGLFAAAVINITEAIRGAKLRGWRLQLFCNLTLSSSVSPLLLVLWLFWRRRLRVFQRKHLMRLRRLRPSRKRWGKMNRLLLLQG